ncbi:Hypothetical_protein [Hexamita inflata]|uniref:Hypothetical_protein n=1 Tax=Hexamita inflata TaxID=28002 RepID=A0AA86PAK3_9EUKA|nr:Hypothetical protein HINF_LOCUS20107 [Hexamita inflata]
MDSVVRLQNLLHSTMYISQIQAKYDKVLLHLKGFQVWRPSFGVNESTQSLSKQIQCQISDLVLEIVTECSLFKPRENSIRHASRLLENELMLDYQFGKLYQLQENIVNGHNKSILNREIEDLTHSVQVTTANQEKLLIILNEVSELINDMNTTLSKIPAHFQEIMLKYKVYLEEICDNSLSQVTKMVIDSSVQIMKTTVPEKHTVEREISVERC